MALLNLRLTATESNWRLFLTRKADKAFLPFQEKIFKRDNHTCQYCGFRAKEFQEIVNIDGNYLNNRLNNLATACLFCTQCFFLEAIGKSDFGGGALIYFPEMSQNQLNALCHVMFNAIAIGTSFANQSRNIYRGLKLRTQHVEKELGEGMSNPSLYGHLLIDAQVAHEHKIALNEKMMEKLRVLPDMVRYVPQIEIWARAGTNSLNYG